MGNQARPDAGRRRDRSPAPDLAAAAESRIADRDEAPAAAVAETVADYVTDRRLADLLRAVEHAEATPRFAVTVAGDSDGPLPDDDPRRFVSPVAMAVLCAEVRAELES